jgi:HK97 family phage major capsid protein
MHEAAAKSLVEAGLLEKIEDPLKKEMKSMLNELRGAVASTISEQVKAGVAELRAGKASGIVVGADLSEARGGFKSAGHFLKDVALAGADGHRMSNELRGYTTKTAGHMSEADDAQGGYLVPTEFRASLLRKLMEATVVRGRATTIPMATNHLLIPAINELSRVSTLQGGVAINATNEAEEKGLSKPTFRQVELTLTKLTGLVHVSDELIQDSPISIEAVVNQAFTESVAFEADYLYLNGTGTGEPLGIINAPATFVQGRATPGTISGIDVINMWAHLHAPSMANAVWIASQSCFPALATASWTPGGGTSIPLWMPMGGMSGNPYQTLMGRPLLYSEKCGAIGAAGDIILADLSQYLIGAKNAGAVEVATSIHVRFIYDEQSFRFVLRHDGRPWWNSELTLRNNWVVSPFVILDGMGPSSSMSPEN